MLWLPQFGRTQPAGGVQWTAALAADSQQDGFAVVATAAPTLTGSPTATYQWALIDPAGVDRVALFTGTSTDADPGGWTPDLPGNWVESCAVTVGSDVQTATRVVQIGDDDGFVFLDLSAADEFDPGGMNDATSSLGVSSTVVLASVHGWFDSGVDVLFLSVDIGTAPTGKSHLHVKMTLTPTTDNPDDSPCGCAIGVSRTSSWVSAEGYWQNHESSTAEVSAAMNVQRIATGTTSTGNMTGTTPVARASFPISATGGPVAAIGTQIGDAEQLTTATTAAASGDWSAGIHVGVAFGRKDTTPAAGLITYNAVRIGYRWM